MKGGHPNAIYATPSRPGTLAQDSVRESAERFGDNIAADFLSG